MNPPPGAHAPSSPPHNVWSGWFGSPVHRPDCVWIVHFLHIPLALRQFGDRSAALNFCLTVLVGVSHWFYTSFRLFAGALNFSLSVFV